MTDVKTEVTEAAVEVAYIIQGDNVVITVNGDNYVINKDTHINYDEIMGSLEAEDWSAVADLVDVRRSMATFYDGEVQIKNGWVEVKGSRLAQQLSDRMIEMYRKKLPLGSLVNFLRKLLDNPSHTAVQELYGFMEKNTLPMTPDGDILAYKRVVWSKDRETPVLLDCYTKSIDNSVGNTVAMKRSDVDDDRNNTCSNGLHFCSLSYLQSSGFGGEDGTEIVIVKINPADVVSIPTDYNNQKGRCSKYNVVRVHKDGVSKEAFNAPVVSVNSDGEEVE